ncbi:MAG: hypothetical protein WC076_04635 [Terrimicrobiaceae bacterium]|jgi:hypothetical protein
MIRTQIQLEPSTYEEMKKRAVQLGCSIAELARRSIEEGLARQRQEDKWARTLEVAGRYRSGLGNLAEQHDEYLSDEW